jgi:hypothetical protein
MAQFINCGLEFSRDNWSKQRIYNTSPQTLRSLIGAAASLTNARERLRTRRSREIITFRVGRRPAALLFRFFISYFAFPFYLIIYSSFSLLIILLFILLSGPSYSFYFAAVSLALFRSNHIFIINLFIFFHFLFLSNLLS